MEKILLAEDDENLRKLFEELIHDSFPDYLIESFVDGNSLVERLEREVMDVRLVVTDNKMPGIFGSKIIKQYAKTPKFKDIPFVLCSGDELIRDQSIEEGAFEFILKPISIIEYNRILSDALSCP